MPKLKTASTQPKTAGDLRTSNTQSQLYDFVERFERLTEEVQALTSDRKEVMDEAKGLGFDTRILRMAIRRRNMNPADRHEDDSVLDLYEETLAREEKRRKEASEKQAGDKSPAQQ